MNSAEKGIMKMLHRLANFASSNEMPNHEFHIQDTSNGFIGRASGKISDGNVPVAIYFQYKKK